MSKAPTDDDVAVAESSAVVLRLLQHQGSETDFGCWASPLTSSAITTPGFAGVMIDSKTLDSQHRDWALTYRFSTREERETWMSSDDYHAALAGSPELFVIPPVEERIDHGGRPRATEAVISVVVPHRLEEYVAARKELDRSVAEFPGFVGTEHHPPSGPHDRRWTTVISFQTAEDLARWRDSPERVRGVRRIRKIAPDVVKVLPWGFGQWFAVDAETTRTPAWKQAMVVLAVLYGMVSVLDMTLGDYLGPGISISGHTWVAGLGAQLPAIVFVQNLIGTALLTWLLMPVITRVMEWWLRPDASLTRTIQGTVLMIAIYAAEITIFIAIYRIYRI